MKKSQLVKIIKDAVREELKSSLPGILTEVMESTQTSSKIKSVDPVDITKRVLERTQVEDKPSPKNQTKRYTKNEALNRVLNETVGGIPQEGSVVGSGSAETITDFQGQEVSVDALPSHVSNALTRNYSDVLNLVDKKRGITK